MSQPQKPSNAFSYLRHARHIPSDLAEEGIPEPAPTSRSEPATSAPPLKKEAKPVRVKFTTNIAPQLRDAVELELAKQKSAGKAQSFADVIDELLREWVHARGVLVDR